MQQLLGFESSTKSMVCKLHKDIYGLKQAPRDQFDRLKETLLKFDFEPNKRAPSLLVYSKGLSTIYMLVHVDDIIIMLNNTPLLQQLVSWLQSLSSELAVSYKFLVIHYDNTSTMSLAHNYVLHAHTKYIKLDFFCSQKSYAQIAPSN